MVAHERLTEPRVTMEWILEKSRSFSNLHAFLDLNGRETHFKFVFKVYIEMCYSILLYTEFRNIARIYTNWIIPILLTNTSIQIFAPAQ